MYKQRINLAELKRGAEQAGARAIKSCSRSRCYIIDHREIVIATTEGVARIPIEQAKMFGREFTTAIHTAAEMLTELSIDAKNELAREKGLTYGKIQAIIAELGGASNEQENR